MNKKNLISMGVLTVAVFLIEWQSSTYGQGKIKESIQQFKQEFQTKQAQSYDVSEAARLIKETGEALQRKDYPKARQLLRDAFIALKNAKKVTQVASTEEKKRPYSVRTIKENTERVDWCPVNNMIAFDMRGRDHFYDVYIMNPDGSGEKCLTCNKPGLPNKHMGNPAWHPSGEWIAFNAEKESHLGQRLSYFSTPGYGYNSDIWIISADGEKYFKLRKTNVGLGSYTPHFSVDGTKLGWSEMYEKYELPESHPAKGGSWEGVIEWSLSDWRINIADFKVTNGNPEIENITQFYMHGKRGLHEFHGFSLNGKDIFFTGVPKSGKGTGEIYRMNIDTGKAERLTNTVNDIDEHAHYTPDEEKILWISSTDLANRKGELPGTELWEMGKNGENKRRLTFFNGSEYLESKGIKVHRITDWTWLGLDGKRIIADTWEDYPVQDDKVMINPDGKTITIPGRKYSMKLLEFTKESSVDEDLPKVKNLKKIGEGIFPKWSPDGGHIAFNKKVKETYEIFTMRPDGSHLRCLTCNKRALASCGHKGQPYWHPSGKYIVFTAENILLPKLRLGLNALPDCGRNHNVWIMTADGSKFYQITNYGNNWGVISPSFSHDGKMLYWNEEYGMEKHPKIGSQWNVKLNPKDEKYGLFRIKVAEISFKGGKPRISNERIISINEIHPHLRLVEGTGFTPDDQGFIFSAADISEAKGWMLWGEIYTSDLRGGSLKRLTDTPFKHDENAEFSPDGKRIVWSTATGGLPGENIDLFIMDADGSDKRCLTYFSKRGFPEYIPEKHYCGEITWSPDGKNIIFAMGTGEYTRSSLNTLYLMPFKMEANDVKKKED